MSAQDQPANSKSGAASGPTKGGQPFQAPRGTRDFYPEDFARRRCVFEAWRGAALRHGFDEVDGPTFEHLNLYTVKSGDGIVSELFSFRRAGGETDFALRPEFTPTLARMVAARANSLPRPIKWFSIGSFFRAERPQRGRLREFVQWNCDILGDESAEADADVIACCVEGLRALGLTAKDVQVRIGSRFIVERFLRTLGVAEGAMTPCFDLIDRHTKISAAEFTAEASKLGLTPVIAGRMLEALNSPHTMVTFLEDRDLRGEMADELALFRGLEARGIGTEWFRPDFSIVRGLAYYTGMVFEVHETGGKERAIAGGGRYDNLVELFGGPHMPAVGFAMGDVVLSLVLQDRGLMPARAALLESIGARPDVFLISNGSEASEQAVRPLLSRLRAAGLHARSTHRATRNVGKLLKEASDHHARAAAIIENAEVCTIKNLLTGDELHHAPLATLEETIRAIRAQ